eukprot:TRINITY_DN4367_c0_g1_i1.p1 TRINITY_DN4367_c0_g1~~TRINITY_DN4367_c0_g1_i1.p1  ORF type:complete len:166 (+),score=30.39 TRINITY_DN4367_c0_g1_i1:33-530(+)
MNNLCKFLVCTTGRCRKTNVGHQFRCMSSKLYRIEHLEERKLDKHAQLQHNKDKHRPEEKDCVVEFSITPLGTSQESSLQHTVEAAARVVVVRGLRHELHPAGTLIEGSMDECFEAVKECITDSLKRAPRIIVGLRADVHPGAQNRLHQHQVEITRILGRIEGET